MPSPTDPTTPPPDVTLLLERVREGDPVARDELVPLLYRELRRLAGRRMAKEARDHTLQPTALVHEAWLRLAGRDEGFRNRAHFFGAAALAMRAILVDHARRRRTDKHGGGASPLPLSKVEPADGSAPVDALALGEALERLEVVGRDKAAALHMRLLLGMTVEETAEALGVSAPKVKKDVAFAKAWLKRELSRS